MSEKTDQNTAALQAHSPGGDSFAAIESTMQENRLFPPPAHFVAEAKINSRAQYDELYRESIDHPEKFWGRAAEELFWFKGWDKVLEWNPPHARWFVGGQTNASYNC